MGEREREERERERLNDSLALRLNIWYCLTARRHREAGREGRNLWKGRFGESEGELKKETQDGFAKVALLSSDHLCSDVPGELLVVSLGSKTKEWGEREKEEVTL